MAYDVGQTVRLPVTVTDEDGDPVNATMVIEVIKPDGTLLAPPAITNDGTGLYHADVTTDGPGTWQWKYSASGAVLPSVYTGQFFVRPAGQRIISLKEAKTHLNKAQVRVDDDDELRDFIDMTTVVLENIKGVIVPRNFTEYHSGGGPCVYLRRRPVLSVVTIQENWGPGDVRTLTAEPDLGVGAVEDQYVLDVHVGRIRRRASGWDSMFPHGILNVKVVYRAGRATVEGNIRLAALQLLTHFWRQSQLAAGGSRPRTNETDVTLVASYGVPDSVRAMLGAKRAPRLGS